VIPTGERGGRSLRAMLQAGRTTLPPGPHRMPAALQSVLIWTASQWMQQRCHRRYGSVFSIYAAPLGRMVYLADPADIKDVFAGDPSVFHAGEVAAPVRGVLGASSVLLLDDAPHRERRRLMMPPFHRDAVAAHATLMAEIAAAEIARWPVGTPFPMVPRMSALTLAVILRIVVGARDPERLSRLHTAIIELTELRTIDHLALLYPGLIGRGPWRRMRRRLDAADALLYAEIRERRADPALADRTDVLAMIIRAGGGLSDEDLRDQLVTLLVAGHATTATTLAWLFERLVRHPGVLRRAVAAAEGDGPEDRDYLDAVVKETLRSRPIGGAVARKLTRPVSLAGFQLPAGVIVAPTMGLVHADPRVYPEPESFDPDRMLGATLSPSTWLPFGGGARRCLGATLAMAEMRIVLREVLRRVELATTTEPAERQRSRHGTLSPHRGGRVRVRARRADPPAGYPD
jgi:cytochrome P450 family 135